MYVTDIRERQPVASLGLVSPGAATDECHPIYKKSDDLFSHRLWELITFLAVVSSPPHLPYLNSHVVYPVFFLNPATTKLILVVYHPMESVTRLRKLSITRSRESRARTVIYGAKGISTC